MGRKAQRSDQSQGGASKDAEGGWGASIRSAAELSWKASPQTRVKLPTRNLELRPATDPTAVVVRSVELANELSQW